MELFPVSNMFSADGMAILCLEEQGEGFDEFRGELGIEGLFFFGIACKSSFCYVFCYYSEKEPLGV